MSHISILIMNALREAMEKLQRTGVGFIGYEETGVISYEVDGRQFLIHVAEVQHDD